MLNSVAIRHWFNIKQYEAVLIQWLKKIPAQDSEFLIFWSTTNHWLAKTTLRPIDRHFQSLFYNFRELQYAMEGSTSFIVMSSMAEN